MTRLVDVISNLTTLDQTAPFHFPRTCKICRSPAIEFDSVDFNKFCDVSDYYRFGMSNVLIKYLRCLSCCFIFTEDLDDWSKEEFTELIYNSDYIKVDGDYVKIRPEQYARDFAERFRGCENARMLDYGSGAGVFVDRMREYGFKYIEAYDPFSFPVRPKGRFDIITCFEVMEHSCDPVGTLADMKALMRQDGCIVFSQALQPPDILSVRGSWWYIAPRNGHVATYSEESLVALGRCCNLILHRGSSIYGFSPGLPSSYANVALNWIGPSFTTLRLLGPNEVGSSAIAFPTPEDVILHPIDDDGFTRSRRTASTTVRWDGRWAPVERLQIRLAFLRESHLGLAARCELELNTSRRPVKLDRGEMVVEFDVTGLTSGQITLHIPSEGQSGDDIEWPTAAFWLALPVEHGFRPEFGGLNTSFQNSAPHRPGEGT